MDIAYLIATQQECYREAVNIAIRALRRLGGFKGEIAVFCDTAFRVPRGVEQILLRPDELDRPTIKCRAGARLDLERYQRVLYLDADVLVRFPLDAILARCDQGRLVCTDDMASKTSWDFFSRCFAPRELDRYGDLPGINAGFFCAPGKQLRKWLRIWEQTADECAGCPGAGYDQPPLNAAIRRGLIPLELIPDQMLFPGYHPNSPDWAGSITDVYARTSQNAPLVHFNGIGVRPDQLRSMAVQYAYHLLTRPLRGSIGA